MNKLKVVIIDSHRNMSKSRREKLAEFFSDVKGMSIEDALQQVEFCEWFEKENAVKWFETMALDGSLIVGYLRCMRNPKDVTQWFIGDVHVKKEYRGQGIASRMYQKTIDTVQEFEAAECIIASVHPDNIRSVGLHKKMGFKNTGHICRFPNFWFDEKETEYRKILYRFLPVPAEDFSTEKLLPLWIKYTIPKGEKRDEDSERKKLQKILEQAQNGECEFESIWCGNRLVGFRFNIGDGEKQYGIKK